MNLLKKEKPLLRSPVLVFFPPACHSVSVLTERVVFLQRSIYSATGVNLQVVFGRAVELPAPRRSTQVFVHSSATPGFPPLPGVASLARGGGAAGPGTRDIQQA